MRSPALLTRLVWLGAVAAGLAWSGHAETRAVANGSRLADYLLPLAGTREYDRFTYQSDGWVADPNLVTQTTKPFAESGVKIKRKQAQPPEGAFVRVWTRAKQPSKKKHRWVGDRQAIIRYDAATDTLRWHGMRIPSTKEGRAPTGLIRWWGRTLEDFGSLPGRILALTPDAAPLERSYQTRVDPQTSVLGVRIGLMNRTVQEQVVRLPSEDAGEYRRCLKVQIRSKTRGHQFVRTLWLAREAGLVRLEVESDVCRERFVLKGMASAERAKG